MPPLVYLITFVISAYLLLNAVQARPSFLLLLPILILTIGVGWYLNKHIQEEHEETLKRGIQNTVDEQNAQHWLHQSFVPKTNILLKQHIKQTILYCGILLLAFIFFWSFLAAGLTNALLNIVIAGLLYAFFVFYVLHVDKWYRYFFKHVPKPYKHLKTNDWIHGYVLLFPFTLLCVLIYTVFNYKGDITTTLLAIPIFLMAYTLAFICLYCCSFLYKEYKKEEDKKVQDAIDDMVKE